MASLQNAKDIVNGIVTEDEIGTTVQAYDATTLKSGDIQLPTLDSLEIANHDEITVQANEPTMTQVLDNPNPYSTSSSDEFGHWVATHGDYAIVSTYKEDDASGTSSGIVYIYNVTNGSLLHTIANPNPYGTSSGDFFGYTSDIYGDYVVIGAMYEDEATGNDSGKAYIYNVTTGSLVHTLDNPNNYDTVTQDFFGRSVAINGTYVAVGAVGEDEVAGTGSGKVYVFDIATGSLVHTLDNPNAYGTVSSDLFGNSVALNDSYLIAGAVYEDDASGTYSGKAYIFDVTSGSLLHTLDNPNTEYGEDDEFGKVVAISENYAIVGAPYEGYENDGSDDDWQSGKAYIYDLTTGNLLHTLDNPNPYGTGESNEFGISVAINDTYAIVGAWGEGDPSDSTSWSGMSYIFDVTTGSLVTSINNPNNYNTPYGDGFGNSVAVGDTYAVISASMEDDASGSTSGKVYIFDLTTIEYGISVDGIIEAGSIKLNTTNGSVTLKPEDGSGNVDITVPRAGVMAADATTGKVLQMKHAYTITATSTTSTSFVDTNLSLTFTPLSATSKIYLILNGNAAGSGGNESNRIGLGIKQDSTQLTSSNSVGPRSNGLLTDTCGYTYSPFGGDGVSKHMASGIIEVDSGSTTARTYTVTLVDIYSNGTSYLSYSGAASQLTAIEIEQ